MLRHYKSVVIIPILLSLVLTIVGCGADTGGPGGTCGVNGNVTNASGCLAYNYPYHNIGDYQNCVTDWGTADTLSCPPPSSDLGDTTPPPSSCTPNYAYDHLIDQGQSWVVVSQQQDQNNSSSPAQVTFTSTTSKTVTVTDKQDVIASANIVVPLIIGVITANVKAEIDHDVTQTVNATIGNSYNFSVPAGETTYANYGVKVQVTSGHLYDKAGCEGQNSNWGTDVTYVPIASGWCVWTNDQPSCPSL